MQYRFLLSVVLCSLMAVSCNNNQATNHNGSTDSTLDPQASPSGSLDVKPLSGYFVKNTITVNDSLTFWVIDNAKTFDSLFGVGKTMNNTIDQPDFGTQLVIAATMPATYYGTQIELSSATIDNLTNNATLRFEAPANQEKGSAAIMPLWLGAIPKTGKSIIKLYTGEHLSTTVHEQP
ncbi:hypothetical protein [Chitinophaga nivalis]|uniref:Uncharacterized protein n=1 Tax=Chitinophaga nivalis TaxID=2991709 RepID=A0ABT3IVP4_9BACT|nr:hypothetical protein [Chitinophaga nivalis]MCW3462261.1 hypothetical protein [Chitinophaga nivalis]MCW3488047.1 hypothetical protein [Chitinophaga nivalis]